jgi:hypothetical protein
MVRAAVQTGMEEAAEVSPNESALPVTISLFLAEYSCFVVGPLCSLVAVSGGGSIVLTWNGPPGPPACGI